MYEIYDKMYFNYVTVAKQFCDLFQVVLVHIIEQKQDLIFSSGMYTKLVPFYAHTIPVVSSNNLFKSSGAANTKT